MSSPSTVARRLSDLLQEQQEPFLLLHLLLQDHDDDSATPARTPAAARRSLLRGSTAATVTKLPLRWADDLLAGCFSFPCAATRQRFRRLPRADRDVVAPADCHDGAGDCGRQLSPVSVLDLHSDDESSAVPSQRKHSVLTNNSSLQAMLRFLADISVSTTRTIQGMSTATTMAKASRRPRGQAQGPRRHPSTTTTSPARLPQRMRGFRGRASRMLLLGTGRASRRTSPGSRAWWSSTWPGHRGTTGADALTSAGKRRPGSWLRASRP